MALRIQNFKYCNDKTMTIDRSQHDIYHIAYGLKSYVSGKFAPIFAQTIQIIMKISKRIRRILLLGVLVGALAGSWAIWYVFYKPHRNVANEKPAFTLTTTDLSKAFETDTAALAKYADKALLLEGAVSSIDGSRLVFENVICSMDSTELPKLAGIQQGQTVKVQGRLTTYNDLMEEIMLDKCVIK
jgi:hypothetical protein